jgi:hypothetical protein
MVWAKEAAEKVGRRMKMRPSAAKAAPVFKRFMYGLKPVPFKEQSFSAACKALFFLAPYGTTKVVP